MCNNWQDQIQKQKKMEQLARRILGVSDDADNITIKKAYWLLAMRYHPDRNPRNEESRKIFENIVNAYEFLIKGKSDGWNPNENNVVEIEETMGGYQVNDWGYFCWWRDNYCDDIKEEKCQHRTCKNKKNEPESQPGDWW